MVIADVTDRTVVSSDYIVRKKKMNFKHNDTCSIICVPRL